MTKRAANSKKFTYWVPEKEEKISKTFLSHLISTAMATDREVDMRDVKTDEFGRIYRKDFDDILEVSNTDTAFPFDCASRHGLTHLQQIGALLVAAPDLDTGLTLFMGCVSFFDDRIIGMRMQNDGKTTYGLFYCRELDAHFYHTQAGSLFLTAVDAWPTQYIDNSEFNFPRVPLKYTSTHGYFWSQRFPWVEVGCNGSPFLAWTVGTNKTKWQAPNYNAAWYTLLINFIKGTLDRMGSERQAWSRFTTNIMMCNSRDLSTKKTCELLQISEQTLSKKLAAEGASASAIKDWILEETAKRAVTEGIKEDWICEQLGYSRGDYRSRLRRREIENPFEYSEAQIKQLIRLYKPTSHPS